VRKAPVHRRMAEFWIVFRMASCDGGVRPYIQGHHNLEWNGLEIDIAVGVFYGCSRWKSERDTSGCWRLLVITSPNDYEFAKWQNADKRYI